MAGRGRITAAPESHGAGDDVLDAAELLLQLGCVGFVVDWYWIRANIAPDSRVRKNLAGPRTHEEARKSWAELESRMQDTLPLDALSEMKDVAPYYLDWLQHPPEDPFWNFAELRGKYVKTNAAVLNLSGWHDDNYGPEGATTNFGGLVQARGGQPSRTALLIGPWVHGVDATGRTKSGERGFGPDAAIDYDTVVLDWINCYVAGKAAAPEPPPVRYFVMGANAWRTAETWPPPAEHTTFVLTAAAPAHPGTLERGTVALVPSSSFVSDPTTRYAIATTGQGRTTTARWSSGPTC